MKKERVIRSTPFSRVLRRNGVTCQEGDSQGRSSCRIAWIHYSAHHEGRGRRVLCAPYGGVRLACVRSGRGWPLDATSLSLSPPCHLPELLSSRIRSSGGDLVSASMSEGRSHEPVTSKQNRSLPMTPDQVLEIGGNMNELLSAITAIAHGVNPVDDSLGRIRWHGRHGCLQDSTGTRVARYQAPVPAPSV